MAGNALTDFSAYFCTTLLFTRSQPALALSHRLVRSTEAGINMVTTGRTRRDQADTALDKRKATVFSSSSPVFDPGFSSRPYH